jgi:pimeloyl-ACP methyl ester carboxylesterase
MADFVTLRNGVTLEYVDQGDPFGMPVVFLHGATDSWRSFEGVMRRLPSWMRAIALSQRGHGRSSKPEEGYRFDDFSDDLARFFDALDLGPALVVGHSMGSYVAQRFAIDHPDRVLGLVLMGSFPTIRGNAAVQELWDTSVAALTDPVDRALALDFQVSTLARPIAADALATFVGESLQVPARVWRALFAEFLEADFSGELNRIAAPSLIVWGDRDAIFPYSDQLALRAAIRHSHLVVYPGAGHAMHWEDPATFAGDLVAFGTEVFIDARFPTARPRPSAYDDRELRAAS